MSSARLYTSLPLSAFAAALLIGTAPAAWAQCQAQAEGSMIEDMSATQQQSGSDAAATGPAVTTAQPNQGDTASTGAGQQGEMAGADTGMTTQQGDTAMAGESGIATDQGGATTDESGNVTAQSGGDASGSMSGDASAEQGGSASGQATAALDSPEIQGPDEEQVKAMLEEQGYSQVSDIYSCGGYYEATAMKDGEEVTLQVDMATGRVNPL